MGCTWGTMGFCLTAGHFVFEPMAKAHPQVVHVAQTDDCIRTRESPASQDEKDWEEVYDDIAHYIAEFSTKAHEIGMAMNMEKEMILVPSWAPLPVNPVRSNGVKLNVVKDGLIVSGVPIGTDAFMRQHADNKLATATAKIEAIVRFGNEEPLAACQMLTRPTTILRTQYTISGDIGSMWEVRQ